MVSIPRKGAVCRSTRAAGVARDRERFAGVCLVDHRSADAAGANAADRLRELVGAGGFRGVRFTAEVLRERPDLFAAAAEAGAVIVVWGLRGVGRGSRS